MKNHLFSENSAGLNFVAIGGGNGLSTLLSGLKRFVAPAKPNRSGSKIFRQLSPFPTTAEVPGVARRTANAAARRHSQLYGRAFGRFALFRNFSASFSRRRRTRRTQFRQSFSRRAFGNYRRFCRSRQTFFGNSGEQRSYLSGDRFADVRLAAELADGSIVRGETNISKIGNSIRRLRLEPENCQPLPETLAAIYDADVITIGPGSLFTSLLPPILVEGVSEAIAESKARQNFYLQSDDAAGRNRRFFGAQTSGNRPRIRAGNKFRLRFGQQSPDQPEELQASVTERRREQIGVHGSISPKRLKAPKLFMVICWTKAKKCVIIPKIGARRFALRDAGEKEVLV
jgi:hypothetical protein